MQYTLEMLRSRSNSLVLVALVWAAPACNDADDDIRANVTLLCNHEGTLAAAAAEHLTRYGRRSIPTIEAAMHTASSTGKKNLILALRKIGDIEAVPLLGHVAQFEPNSDVRREAEWTLRQWAADAAAKERAVRAKQAVRVLEEANGTEDAG